LGIVDDDGKLFVLDLEVERMDVFGFVVFLEEEERMEVMVVLLSSSVVVVEDVLVESFNTLESIISTSFCVCNPLKSPPPNIFFRSAE